VAKPAPIRTERDFHVSFVYKLILAVVVAVIYFFVTGEIFTSILLAIIMITTPSIMNAATSPSYAIVAIIYSTPRTMNTKTLFMREFMVSNRLSRTLSTLTKH
jgi:hypothetical protein